MEQSAHLIGLFVKLLNAVHRRARQMNESNTPIIFWHEHGTDKELNLVILVVKTTSPTVLVFNGFKSDWGYSAIYLSVI